MRDALGDAMDKRPVAASASAKPGASSAVPRLGFVVPCFNEQQALSETARQLGALLAGLIAASIVDGESAITFVDDGSRDATRQMIEAMGTQASAPPRSSSPATVPRLAIR